MVKKPTPTVRIFQAAAPGAVTSDHGCFLVIYNWGFEP
jgi:hypothetical protein